MVLDELTATLLDPTVSPGDLKSAADAMHAAFCRVVALDEESDTGLPSGRALSPRRAAGCIEDAARTAVFLRGIEQAIRERSPVEVVYAGSGPFAPLVLPLVPRFPGVHFTVIDIHRSAVESLRELITHFEITNCELVLGDSAAYEHGRPIDLLIVEALQAALANEPQVGIVRNLVPQLAPDGVLIPQRITVEAMLVDAAAETGRAMGEPLQAGTRIPLGTVVELTRDTMRLELTARVPDHHHALAYFTTVEVFGRHVLREYDSGITYPQFDWNMTPRAGELLRLRYEMGARPGIVASRIPSQPVSIEIAEARERARAKGYVDPSAVRLYALLSVALGPRFDERARVSETLAQAKGSLDERLLALAGWSHPNCWLRDDGVDWEGRMQSAVELLEWPDDVPIPAQLHPSYGFQIDVPFYTTPEPVVTTMLDLAELTPDDCLLDLGSGDGRIAIAAARKYGVRAIGIEIDPSLVREATAAAEAAGVGDRVSFRRLDLLDADVSDASVVTLYLLRDVNLRMRDRLRAQLRPGSRIVSRSFDMGEWVPDAVVQTPLGPVYRWRT